MGQRAVASDQRRQPIDDDDEQDAPDGAQVLAREAAQRNKRIKVRREQQLKKDAAKRIAKRNRMFKVAGIWVAVLIAAFLVVVWFTPEIMKTIRGVMR